MASSLHSLTAEMRKISRPCLGLGATGLLLLSSALPATAQDETRINIEEILVSGRSIEETLPLALAEYGADLEIITDEMIRNHGFVDVGQSLEMLVPGLYLTSQAGAFSYLNVQMQGSRSSDILWTLDGVRINNRLYNSTSPADTLPSSMIERTEVLKGSHSLMYGTQAIAGVVNVVTRGFSDTTDGNITIGTGSHGLQRVNGYMRGAVDNHKLVGWVSRDKSDGYEIYDNYQPSAEHRKRGYKVDNFGLKYGYEFSPELSLSMTGIHTEAKLDYPNVRNVSINDRSEDIFSARLDYIPRESTRFFLKGYYHTWDTDYYTPPNPSAYWGYEDMGITAATVLAPEGAFEYHLGYDFQTYKGQDDVLLIAGDQEDVHAVYGQIRSNEQLSERARFAAGVRYDDTGGNDSTTWNVSGVYDLSENLYVQGMVATSFMLPSAENLYRIHCPTGEGCTHGNPSLAPEESIGVNLSIGGYLDVASSRLQWQLSGWNRSVDNLLTRAPIPADELSQYPQGFTNTYVNIAEETDVSGAELLLRGPLTSALSFDISYTYSREVDSGTGQQIQDRPRRQYKASLSYDAQTLPFGANLALKYVGDKSTNVTGFGRQEYGDYYLVDAGMHVYLDQDQSHRLTLRLENLLDEEYGTSIGSSVLEGSDTEQRFRYQRLGAPRTVHFNYSYSF